MLPRGLPHSRRSKQPAFPDIVPPVGDTSSTTLTASVRRPAWRRARGLRGLIRVASAPLVADRPAGAGLVWEPVRVWLWGSLMLVGAASLLAPAPAAAHVRTGTLSTDFEARVVGLRPATPGISARTRDGDLMLELRVAPRRVVIVLGYLGEPFLRFSPTGIEANLASPTAGSTGVVAIADAASSSGVKWHQVRDGHVLAWHDNRLRPAPAVSRRALEPREVARWSIPLVVDGRATTLTGSEWYSSGPSPWPWAVSGLALVAVAALGGRRLSRSARRAFAYALLAMAVGALLASWAGIILAGRTTMAAMSLAGAFALVSTAFLLLVIAAAKGSTRLVVIALIGGFAAAFASPEVAIFGHGFVLSALPAEAARVSVVAAVAGGAAVVALCAPVVAEFLVAGQAASRQRG